MDEIITTTNNEIAMRKAIDVELAVRLATDGLTSQNSKRAYGQAVIGYLSFLEENNAPMNKATVNAYKQYLRGRNLSPSTINLKLAAIRKLAAEMVDNATIDPMVANGIKNTKGIRAGGRRSGNWLTIESAQELLLLPDTRTLAGKRDRAILAVMVGCGLRRSEVASLTIDKIQLRDARWVLIDITGKGNKIRTVPMPVWAKVAIDDWLAASGIKDGRLFRAINKRGRLSGKRDTGKGISGGDMSDQAIANVVAKYARKLGANLAAHDLRRTFAKLAYRNGAGLDQIQLTLGHASIKTTENYLGVEQDLTTAPCDYISLRVK